MSNTENPRAVAYKFGISVAERLPENVGRGLVDVLTVRGIQLTGDALWNMDPVTIRRMSIGSTEEAFGQGGVARVIRDEVDGLNKILWNGRRKNADLQQKSDAALAANRAMALRGHVAVINSGNFNDNSEAVVWFTGAVKRITDHTYTLFDDARENMERGGQHGPNGAHTGQIAFCDYLENRAEDTFEMASQMTRKGFMGLDEMARRYFEGQDLGLMAKKLSVVRPNISPDKDLLVEMYYQEWTAVQASVAKAMGEMGRPDMVRYFEAIVQHYWKLPDDDRGLNLVLPNRSDWYLDAHRIALLLYITTGNSQGSDAYRQFFEGDEHYWQSLGPNTRSGAADFLESAKELNRKVNDEYGDELARRANTVKLAGDWLRGRIKSIG